MSLIPCTSCQHSIAPNAPACPKCGGVNARAKQEVKPDVTKLECDMCYGEIGRLEETCGGCGAPNVHYRPSKLKDCLSCGHDVAPNAPHCPSCGAEDPDNIATDLVPCDNCGQNISMEIESCIICDAPNIVLFSQRQADEAAAEQRQQNNAEEDRQKRRQAEERRKQRIEKYRKIDDKWERKILEKEKKPANPSTFEHDETWRCRSCGKTLIIWSKECKECAEVEDRPNESPDLLNSEPLSSEKLESKNPFKKRFSENSMCQRCKNYSISPKTMTCPNCEIAKKSRKRKAIFSPLEISILALSLAITAIFIFF